MNILRNVVKVWTKVFLTWKRLFCLEETPAPGNSIHWICDQCLLQARASQDHKTVSPVYKSSIDLVWKVVSVLEKRLSFGEVSPDLEEVSRKKDKEPKEMKKIKLLFYIITTYRNVFQEVIGIPDMTVWLGTWILSLESKVFIWKVFPKTMYRHMSLENKVFVWKSVSKDCIVPLRSKK